MPISYNDEVSKLGTFSGTGNQLPWWNPIIGSHRVTILEEGNEYTTTFRNKEVKKVRYVIQVNGEKYNWGVNKGRTLASLWGQLALCGKEWNGLTGKDISLIVKMTTRQDGTNVRSYTILESLEIQQKQQQAQTGQATIQQAAVPTPAQGAPGGVQARLIAMKGQELNKAALMSTLGIDETALNGLISLGMISVNGNICKVV